MNCIYNKYKTYPLLLTTISGLLSQVLESMKTKLLAILPALYGQFGEVEREKIYRECVAELMRTNGAEHIRAVFLPPSSSSSCLTAPLDIAVEVLSDNVNHLLSIGTVFDNDDDDGNNKHVKDTDSGRDDDDDEEEEEEEGNGKPMETDTASGSFVASLSKVTLLLECLFGDMISNFENLSFATPLSSDVMKMGVKLLALLNNAKLSSVVLSAAYTQSLMIGLMNKVVSAEEFREFLMSSSSNATQTSSVAPTKKKRSTRGAAQSNSLSELAKKSSSGVTNEDNDQQYSLNSLRVDIEVIISTLLTSTYTPTREAALKLLHTIAPVVPEKILDSIELLGNVITKFTNEPNSKNTNTMLSGEEGDRDEIIVETLRTFVEVIRSAKNSEHHDTHQIVNHAFFKHINAFPLSRRRFTSILNTNIHTSALYYFTFILFRM